MKFISKRLAGAAAAVVMVAAPVAVSAQTAAEPQTAPADTPPADPSDTPGGGIAEGSTATLINIGILAALVVGVLVATGGDDDDAPDSP